MHDDTKSKIAELEKELYAKEFTPRKPGTELHARDVHPAPSSWNERGDEAAQFVEDLSRVKSRGEHRLMKKILLASILFFVAALAIGGYVWYRGENLISGERIVIDAVAPVAVAGGEQFETALTISNNNNVPLEEATLYIEYPGGFSDERGATLERFEKKIGTIASGGAASERVRTSVYGEENTEKEIRVFLEYRIAGSNAVVKKESSYTVTISSSPVAITLGLIKEVTAGQEVEMVVTVESRIQAPQEGLLVEAQYPPDFTFKSSDPEPADGDRVWNIGTLAGQGTQTIKIRGIIDGREGEVKSARFLVGGKDPKDDRRIGTVFSSVAESTKVTKPFFSIDVSLDGDRSVEHAVPFGKNVRADIFWKNNNASQITDATIEVKLKGQTLNRYSVYASSGGFYRSLDDTIVWGKAGTPELAIIQPSSQGSMSFGFSPSVAGVGEGNMIKNPQITLEIIARARRVPTAADATSEVIVQTIRKVKIETDIRLAAKVLYYAGPFTNTGPLPPRVEQDTTYTVVWTVRNASNNISNVEVKTALPVYVKWLGNVSPLGESISYDDRSSIVTWNAGRIPAGGTREAAFQISLTPSLSQLKQSPTLVGESILTATDDFTKTTVGDRRAQLSTLLSSDTPYRASEGSVVE